MRIQIDLLEFLDYQAGCAYLSDLPRAASQQRTWLMTWLSL